MENKQTAVKFLWQWIMKNPLGSFDDGIKAYNKAKQMEKEQIKNAFIDGEHQQGFELEAEQYYNKTDGKE